jgi:hypothetical protein
MNSHLQNIQDMLRRYNTNVNMSNASNSNRNVNMSNASNSNRNVNMSNAPRRVPVRIKRYRGTRPSSPVLVRKRKSNNGTPTTRKRATFNVNSNRVRLVAAVSGAKNRAPRVLLQKGGTCWFHAMSFFLMCSPEVQKLVRFVIAQEVHSMSSAELLNFMNMPTKSCTRFGVLPSDYNLIRFMFHFMFNPTVTGQINSLNYATMLNLAPNNRTSVLANSGLFAMPYMDQLVKRLRLNSFINVIRSDTVTIPSTPAPILIFSPKVGQVYQDDIAPRLPGYMLRSVLLYLSRSGNSAHTSHSICGFIDSTGSSYLADSNMNQLFKCDIFNSKSVVIHGAYKAACTRIYGAPFTECRYEGLMYVKIA